MVSDGDTVTVLDAERHQYKVRLAGIDAPEKTWPFGQVSKTSLSDQTFGRVGQLGKKDRNGRIICKISVDQRDVCLEQIRRGMAWHYKQYARDQAAVDRGSMLRPRWPRAYADNLLTFLKIGCENNPRIALS